MRLIDADALFRAIKNSDWLPHERIEAMKMVREQPTIDAVPVVRCKDCYLHGECMTEDAFHWSGIQNPYCAAGKKDGE